MSELLVRPELPPRWPAAVRAELERRHAVLARHLAPVAPVLDISVPEGRAVLADVLAGGAPPERYAAVVSVAGLVRQPDLGAAVAAVDRLLDDDGELHAVEPVGRPGLVGLVVGSAGALLPQVRGAHLSRDLPDVLRARGLTVADCLRPTMPTAVWPLRRFVQLRALRIPGRPPAGAAR